MKLVNTIFLSLIISSVLSACGGSSGGTSTTNTESPDIETPQPEPSLATLSLSVIEAVAIEKSNVIAKFKIDRSGTNTALNINFQITAGNDITKGSASTDDYQLVYSDGGNVGNTLAMNEGQNSRVIEVRPIKDGVNEVPEFLMVSLVDNENYTLTTNNSVSLKIIDATNERENAKVFLGVFAAQNGANTSATGVLSFIIQGDNEQGELSYTFSNLSTAQTDQHIHLSPSGTVIKDIEDKGTINKLIWDLAPGGIFVNEQQMLDALFNGEFFINIHTASYPHGEISATLAYQANILPPEDVTLSHSDVDNDIIRFLIQSTFGATPETYQALRDKISLDGSNRLQIYQAWIEEQFSLPQTSLLALTDELVPFFPEENVWHIRRDGFWHLALYAKDQLRQRMALALSEILVIGDDVVTIRNAHRGTAHYWDQLAENGFGYYNKTLLDASVHPIMGFWLSHLKNQKENAELGFFPDENYAREVMQLFSIGLVQRAKNGTIKLSEDNLPIPTYDNNVIKEMAKVFTGLSFSYKESDGTKVSNNNFNLWNQVNDDQYRWTEPLKFFPNEHEFEAKTLFTDNNQTLVIEKNSEQTEVEANNELTSVINGLVSHSSAAPFISRKLIQRFVTSNPSPEYIERVARAFGSTGDLKATIKAILLDPEARSPSVANSIVFGKVKEPILQLSSIMRLFKAESSIPLNDQENGLNLTSELISKFDEGVTLLMMGDPAIGQRALGSPSVFNFFTPDFSPTGELSSNSLVAPELQLATESQLFSTFNVYNKLLYSGFSRWKLEDKSTYSEAELKIWLQESSFNQLWASTIGSNTDKATAIVDSLDFYLNSGQLKQTQNQGTRQTLIETIAQASDSQRFDLAIYGIATLPELLIQK